MKRSANGSHIALSVCLSTVLQSALIRVCSFANPTTKKSAVEATHADPNSISGSHSSVNKSYPPLDQVSVLVQSTSVIEKHRKSVLKHAYPNDAVSAEKANLQRLPGPLPGAVGLKDLTLIHREPQYWWVTAKMDGMRFMLFITYRDCYLIDREFRFRKLKDGSWYCREFASHDFETLLDGELIWEDSGNGIGSVSSLKFMVFDCLVWKGVNVVNDKVSVRLHNIQQMAEVCAAHASQRDGTQVPMFAKRMYPASEVLALMGKLEMMPSRDGYTYRDDDSEEYMHRKATCSYATLADGLVFMLEDSDYHFKKKNSLIKWKLSHTVDVMTSVSSARSSDVMGMLTVATYYFSSKNDVVPFADVPVEHSLWMNLVTKARESNAGCETVCVECAYVSASKSWIVERGRPEKTYPNSAYTIASTMKTIQEDITHELLLESLDYSRPPQDTAKPESFERKDKLVKQISRIEPISKPAPSRVDLSEPRPKSGSLQKSLDVVVERIKELIDDWKKGDTWELEGRVKGNISKSMYEDVLRRLSSDKLLSNKTVTSTRDLFYGGLRVTTGDRNEIIQKGRGQNVDIQIGDTQWALRIGLKNEVPVQRPADLGHRSPELVRIKERITFTYNSHGKACWAFDITKVRQGSEFELKRQEDLAQQNNRELEWVYELEVEAMRVERLLLDSRTNIAKSLVLKLLYYYLGIPLTSTVELHLR